MGDYPQNLDSAGQIMRLVAVRHPWISPWVEFLAKGWTARGADWLWHSVTILETRRAVFKSRPIEFPDTPYWRIWKDLAKADYQRQWPRWFWRRLFMWWARQAGKPWTR